jgi:hypothetical protein
MVFVVLNLVADNVKNNETRGFGNRKETTFVIF